MPYLRGRFGRRRIGLILGLIVGMTVLTAAPAQAATETQYTVWNGAHTVQLGNAFYDFQSGSVRYQDSAGRQFTGHILSDGSDEFTSGPGLDEDHFVVWQDLYGPSYGDGCYICNGTGYACEVSVGCGDGEPIQLRLLGY